MRTIKIQIERKRNATTILIEDQSGRLTEKEEKKVRRALNAKIHIMRKEVEDVLPWITDASAPSQVKTS
jgi:23S rRNA maturation mini-RNase III